MRLCDLHIGMPVLIAREVATGFNGWGNCWASTMDRYIGRIVRVTNINRAIREIEVTQMDANQNGDPSRYGWPPECFDPVSYLAKCQFCGRSNELEHYKNNQYQCLSCYRLNLVKLTNIQGGIDEKGSEENQSIR